MKETVGRRAATAKINPVKIRRSKDVIRFYFFRGKKTVSVKFSLRALLTLLFRQQTAKEKPALRQLVLQRAQKNPILSPNIESRWESSAVFNSGTIFLNDKVHFIYRAIGESGLSVFGYASSKDGIRIDERSAIPAFVSDQLSAGHESGAAPYPYSSGGSWWGSEDPRLTMIEDRIFMTYTAFDGVSPPRVALTSIRADDFLAQQWNWEKPKIISEPGKTNKNWVVFPEKISNKYAVLHSLTPEISIAYRDTLVFEHNDFIKSHYYSNGREDSWDNWMRGVGAPPVKTDEGWLVLYHAMDKKDPGKYKLGAMVLDITEPRKILYRSDSPLLEPDEWYENDGHKKGVIYNCGASLIGEKLFIYYGGADTFICAACVDLKTLLAYLKKCGGHRCSWQTDVADRQIHIYDHVQPN